MTKEEGIKRLIAYLKGKDGYLEKSKSAYDKDHSIVFDKTKGAGKDNRCEAWEVLKPDYNKSSNPWCVGFVHLAFQEVFGKDIANKMLYLNDWKGNEPYTYYSCYGWYTNFENHGQRYQSSKAQVGDIIYFTKSHTGIVVDIKDGYVYTCEGNTSGASGVVSNGGGVVYGKKYKLGIDSILCYGRPNWSAIENIEEASPANKPTIFKGYKDEEKGGMWCKTMQIYLNKLGYTDNDGNVLATDGHCGSKSEEAIRKCQAKLVGIIDGRCGVKTWAAMEAALEKLSKPTVTGTEVKALENIKFTSGQTYHYDKEYGDYVHIVELDIYVNCNLIK